MKKLSDYQNEEAVDLWADLLEPIMSIVQNKKIQKLRDSGKPIAEVAKTVIVECRSEVVEILLRIDPTPIDGLNILTRLISLLYELEASPEVATFLGLLNERESQPSVASTDVTENTKDAEQQPFF